VRVAALVIDGYFHTMIWFNEYPCVLTISLMDLDHMRLHTCDPVSTALRDDPDSVFQNRMHRSAVPPPDASSPAVATTVWAVRTALIDVATSTRTHATCMHTPSLAQPTPWTCAHTRRATHIPCWCGDHAMALTAAWCSENLSTGCGDAAFQISSCGTAPHESIRHDTM
jgi:hypothetical protein